MKIILIIGFTLFFISAKAQKFEWFSTTNWRLYDLKGRSIFKYSDSSLKQVRYVLLNNDSIILLIRNASLIPSGKEPVWMGAYVASCEQKGKVIKIEISQYGGFFYNEADQKYYELPENLKKDWLEYLSQYYMKFSH